MLGALKGFFSIPGIDKVATEVGKGLDKLKYTAEEKADDAAKLLAKQAEIRLDAQKQIVAWQVATQPQNATRRRLALLIAYIWASTYAVRILMMVTAAFWPDFREPLHASAAVLEAGISDIEPYMLTVVGFYFTLEAVKTWKGDKTPGS